MAEIFYQHKRWLKGKKGGARADLVGADLSGVFLRQADLRQANLSKVNLRCASAYNLYGVNFIGADLTGANLDGACLENAILIDANLTNASLIGANLREAQLSLTNLKGACLIGADLCNAIGNGREILTIFTDWIHVNITDHEVWIDTHHYPWDQWMGFSDIKIKSMLDSLYAIDPSKNTGNGAMIWWQEWKPKLSAIIDKRNKSKEMVVRG